MPSLAEVKDQLNIPSTSTGNDAELGKMLARATKAIGSRVGPLAPVTITDEVHTGPGAVVLRKQPVISVTSATSSGVAVGDLDLDREAGVLYGTFSAAPRAVRVTYVAGWASVPEDLDQGVLELVQHLWKTQRGGGSTRAAFPGEGEDQSEPDGSGYLLPYRVQSLIEPYLLVPATA